MEYSCIFTGPMSLYIASLNSGSNGNCYYIGNSTDAVLIDAGISCREIEKRLKRLALSIKKIKAVFVTHEHRDHIKGLTHVAKKHKLPVYITRQTLEESRVRFHDHLVNVFQAYAPVTIGSLQITPFPTYHDAKDPHNFIINHQGITVGVFTDIGRVCHQVVNHFKACHAAFLESNYDEVMLDQGSYSYFLKARIRGGNGHLSNRQAFDLVTRHRPAFMSHLILSHLSKNNNDPAIVTKLFDGVARSTQMQIIIASRYQETPVYEISPLPVSNNSIFRKESQLTLF
jgi:phosphoribosyl 1,2-cyclic phosphodiesterase